MVRNAAKRHTEVTAYDHDDRRPNIPTADAAATFYDEARDALPPLRYARNADLDPQLVWKGKEAEDGEDLIIDAPPIYIQEKIAPRALIDNLTKQSKLGASNDSPSLFDFGDFDTLDELAQVEFYQHEESWKNRMILGDSLQVMGSLAEREALRGKVQMIYVDPPYGIKFGSNWQVRASKRDVKDGKLEDAAREAEQIKAFRDTWELGIHSYLSYLRDRLVVARDLLLDSGSVFVQIGDENVHLARAILDETFGPDNFVSQIKFASTSGFAQASALGRAGDYVLWYAKHSDRLKSRSLWWKASERQAYGWVELADGTRRGLTKEEKEDLSLLPAGARLYAPDNIQSQGASSKPQPFTYKGKRYAPGASAHWKASYPAGMERLAWAGRIHVAANSIRYVRFADDFGYQPFNNTWTDTATGNFTDDKIYVVQTGSKVIERCILLATDPGDLVLDPTCGSGTTAFVAEQWGRRWITIDTSRVALALARQRLMGARYPYFTLADSDEGRRVDGLPPA
jgi:adenine-specific DNA-methyltransferase